MLNAFDGPETEKPDRHPAAPPAQAGKGRGGSGWCQAVYKEIQELKEGQAEIKGLVREARANPIDHEELAGKVAAKLNGPLAKKIAARLDETLAEKIAAKINEARANPIDHEETVSQIESLIGKLDQEAPIERGEFRLALNQIKNLIKGRGQVAQ